MLDPLMFQIVIHLPLILLCFIILVQPSPSMSSPALFTYLPAIRINNRPTALWDVLALPFNSDPTTFRFQTGQRIHLSQEKPNARHYGRLQVERLEKFWVILRLCSVPVLNIEESEDAFIAIPRRFVQLDPLSFLKYQLFFRWLPDNLFERWGEGRRLDDAAA